MKTIPVNVLTEVEHVRWEQTVEQLLLDRLSSEVQVDCRLVVLSVELHVTQRYQIGKSLRQPADQHSPVEGPLAILILWPQVVPRSQRIKEILELKNTEILALRFESCAK